LAQVIAQSRRLFLILVSAISLKMAFVGVSRPFVVWSQHWVTHYQNLLTLTVVNTGITTATELGARTIIPAVTQDKTEGFFVKSANGKSKINRQSVINILMTLFASLLGGPVYYIQRRWARYLFFLGFGTFNSLLAQSVSSYFIVGGLGILMNRFIFDLCYNSTLKFVIFEYARPILLAFQKRAGHITGIRVTQDFISTLSRVSLLSFFGIKG
jgi:hypothetical protein